MRSAVSSRIDASSPIRAAACRAASFSALAWRTRAPCPAAGVIRLGRDQKGDLAFATQPAQARGGEDYCVDLTFLELAQPGVDVAVQLAHPQVGAGGEKLGAAAQAGGADPGALGHVVQR